MRTVRGPEHRGVLVGRLLAERVVVCDGAMGTMLHSAGIPLDRSLSELNLVQPGLVRDLHAAYAAAGAHIVQTNTFDANRLRLARFGLEDSTAEINVAGARLAREAVARSDPPVLVAGSVGPAMSPAAVPRIPAETRAATLREQVAALADWVDLVVLETFGDIESLVQAVDAATQESDLPIVAQMTFGDDGRTLRGEEPSEVAAVLGQFELAAIGANCTVGPAVLQDVVTELAGATTLPVTVQPNAGTPGRLGRQVRYARDTRYFAEAARLFVEGGAAILGGCCGTTPAHIRAIARAAEGLAPPRRAAPATATAPPVVASTAPVTPDPGIGWPTPDRFLVIGGLPAPRGSDVAAFVEHGRELRGAGADLLAITDPAPPRARVNPVAAGVVLAERVGTEVLLPVETVDRSLAALQADLLGAHALGLRMVVCRTGAPRVVGDYPDPGTLWDVDSVGLIAVLRGLNEGVDWRGVATPERTRFVIGGSLRTSAVDAGRELDHAEEKVRAGAHFLLTDVVYDVDAARRVLGMLRARGVELPVIAVLAPFEDPRTVERLSREVPEVSIRSAALAAARRASERPQQAVDAALATVQDLRSLVSGVLISVPAAERPHAVDLLKRLAHPNGAR